MRHYLPTVEEIKPQTQGKRRHPDLESLVPTGCVCAGSWMYGVGVDSRSRAIQAQVLGQLTSLESAQRRAELGAGIPARRDFFHISGEQPVKGMEYMNWRELLRFCGSRARRRDRVLSRGPEPGLNDPPNSPGVQNPDPLPLYSVIHDEMLACLRVADLCRQQYATCSKQTALERVLRRSDQAVATIYEKACSIQLTPDIKRSEDDSSNDK